MEQTVSATTLPPTVGSLYYPVENDMARVDALLREELNSKYEDVDQVLSHGIQLGGKRLRPALLLLTAQATGRITSDHHVLAAVVEMIHLATLVHDDVLDEAELRRHKTTVNARWNNRTSVLLGDFLFSHAFYMASTLGSTLACQAIGKSTNLVCEGEMRQVLNQGNWTLTEKEYMQIIDAKTAELCTCCCLLGAQYAGAHKHQSDQMAAYGRWLGKAFQIIDDLLDVEGTEDKTGKTLGSDLRQRKATLPLIHALQQAQRPDRQQMLNALENETLTSADFNAWLDRFKSLDYARDKAHTYAIRARTIATELPASDAQAVLLQLTEFVLARAS